MSVKEFFAFPSIKSYVIEYLKVKADYDVLSFKFKKAFRAHVNKHQGQQQQAAIISANQQQQQQSTTEEDSKLENYFVSDGFQAIKCVFSEACREKFHSLYPESLRIHNIINMLITVENFRLELRSPAQNVQTTSKATAAKALNLTQSGEISVDVKQLNNLEVVLVIDELRVISFDRYGMKMPSSVAFDDQVRTNLSYLRHFLMKEVLVPQEFEMAPLNSIPPRNVNHANEERSSYFGGQSSLGGGPRSINVRNAFAANKNAYQNSKGKDFVQNSVIQIREEFTGAKQNRMQKQKNKEAQKLRKLNTGASIGGFMSTEQSQNSLIDTLQDSGRTLKDNYQEYGDDEPVTKPVITASQVQRNQEELEEIDQIMEGLIGDDDDEVIDGDDDLKKSQKSFSPSQPVLLSQKVNLMQDALKQSENKEHDDIDDCDLDEILGEVSLADAEPQSAQIIIANNEEKISNSSTPMENEKIQRKARAKKGKNKIELNVEMTEEMKRQEQSINFGATPYSSKSISVQNSIQQQQIGIGNGLDSMRKQKEFIEFKRQGQQGVQNENFNSPSKQSQKSSQMDILDMIEEPLSKQSNIKSQSQSQRRLRSTPQKQSAAKTKATPATAKAPPAGQSSLTNFFIKREGKNQPPKQNQVVVTPKKASKVTEISKAKKEDKVSAKKGKQQKKEIVLNPEEKSSPIKKESKKVSKAAQAAEEALLKKRSAATRPRGATPVKKEEPTKKAKKGSSAAAPIQAPSPAKSVAQDPKKSAAQPAKRQTRGTQAKQTQEDDHESIENSSQQVSQPGAAKAGRGRKASELQAMTKKAAIISTKTKTKAQPKAVVQSPAKATRSSARGRGGK